MLIQFKERRFIKPERIEEVKIEQDGIVVFSVIGNPTTYTVDSRFNDKFIAGLQKSDELNEDVVRAYRLTKGEPISPRRDSN